MGNPINQYKGIKGWILLSFYGRWEGNVLHLDAETCNGQRIFSSPTSGSRTNVHVDPAPVWWLQSVKRTFRTTSFENNLEIKQIQTVIRAFSGILILIYIYIWLYIYIYHVYIYIIYIYISYIYIYHIYISYIYIIYIYIIYIYMIYIYDMIRYIYIYTWYTSWIQLVFGFPCPRAPNRSGGQRSYRLSSATWKSRDGGDPNSWLVYLLVNIQKTMENHHF